MSRLVLASLVAVLVPAAALPLAAKAPDLAAEVAAHDLEAIRARGPAVLDELVRLYTRSGPDVRAQAARVFYGLGWKSEAARRVLMQDVHTDHQSLRLQVQWALGRVSDHPEVVDVLLENMRRDGNALFRDKAACALAYDQIHLAPAQRIRLYEGLVAALDDDNPQVRGIALLALTIHTRSGARGLDPQAQPEARAPGVAAWRRWVAEYKAQYP